jgi:hypothetical protein
MVLKFLDRPQLGRNPRGADSVVNRAPAGAMPIHTAPDNVRFVAIESDGKQSWAMKHRGSVHRLKPIKDSKSGVQRLYSDGPLPNATWWLPPRSK